MIFLLGILSGLCASLFQNSGYVISRLYVKRGGQSGRLLAGTQLLMGGVMLPGIVWAYGVFEWRLIWPLLGSAFGSLAGQYFFFRAEKQLDPPQVSSLMGLRTVVIFFITLIFFGERYHPLQIGAVALAAVSAFVMNYRGGRIQWGGMNMLGCSLIFYAVSDISVMKLVLGMNTSPLPLKILAAMTVVNTLLAAVSLSFIRRERPLRLGGAAPFAAVWLVKQFFLYGCYGLVGPVFGNVVMSLRGPIALAMTAFLRRFGIEGLEEPAGPRYRRRRLAAVAMMTAAIILYALA